jgi:N-acetylmuramoyl-L-alanine amidase
MPSVLTEVGFISNPEEEQYLNTEEGTDALAKSIFNAFQQYKLKHDMRRSKIKVPLRPEEDKEQEVKHSYTVENQEKPDTTNQKIKKSVEVLAKKEERGSTPPKESGLVFKIQILSSGKKLKTNDARFKDLTPVECFIENGVYKYTYGASENYNKVLHTKREIATQFKDAFIIAFKDGEKINVNTAIAEFKKNKK